MERAALFVLAAEAAPELRPAVRRARKSDVALRVSSDATRAEVWNARERKIEAMVVVV